jgi:hypothetical protein
MLTLLAGPIGKLIGGALCATALAGGLWFAVHDYNAMIRAEAQVSEQTAQMAQMQSDHLRIVAGLNAAAALASARASNAITIREAINAAQPSTCVSPAIRAALDGLRGTSANSAGAAPASP